MKNLLPLCTLMVVCSMLLFSCSDATKPVEVIKKEKEVSKAENYQMCRDLLQKHLDAVTNKDIAMLKSTLTPEGDFYFVLPQSKITTTVEEFAKSQEAWFQDTTWTFETEILSLDAGPEIGFAVVETIYREPERNGAPYFNKMAISYGLRKINGAWYVAKDHACTLDKTKPKE